MFARVVQLQKRGFDARMVQMAVNALRDGALVVLPTETVYGIAVRADDPIVVEHLIAAKNRSEKNPFTLLFTLTLTAGRNTEKGWNISTVYVRRQVFLLIFRTRIRPVFPVCPER